MSTILKALQRLDEQRRSEAAPRSLQDQVLAGGASPSRAPHRRWGFIAGGAAVAAFAAAGTWFTLRTPHGPDVAANTPAPAAQAAHVPAPLPSQSPHAPAPESTQPPEARPLPGTPVDASARAGLGISSARVDAGVPRADDAEPALAPAPPSTALRSEAAAPLVAQTSQGLRVPRAERGDDPRLRPTRMTAERRAASPATTPPASPPRIAAAPSARATSASKSARAEVPPPAPRAEAASDAAPDDADPGATRDAPASVAAADDPSLRVERTQWHPTPEKRSAWVRVGEDAAARELHEGDVVDGCVVKEIRPSGVLFERDGRELKRSVGASE